MSDIPAPRRAPDEHPDAGGPDPSDLLTEEQRALLDRLVRGDTIAAAATAEFLSLRTANRRIAEARRVLGAATTREAVLAYLRLIQADGWPGPVEPSGSEQHLDRD